MMTTTQTMLNVSFDDKEYAKKAGAKWNPSKKSWYIETKNFIEYTKTFKQLKQDVLIEQKKEQEQKKLKDNRIYLDDDDIYMREYATRNGSGYYISYDKLKEIQNNNNGKYNNDNYFISFLCILHNKKVIELAGIKTFTYKNVFMKGNPFDDRYIRKGEEYYVANNSSIGLLEIISGGGSGRYNLKLLFNACLNNYDIIKYMTEEKVMKPYLWCSKYDSHYQQMQRDYLYQYKDEITKKLKKYFYKDVSNIINDYLIEYIKVPKITREEYEQQ